MITRYRSRQAEPTMSGKRIVPLRDGSIGDFYFKTGIVSQPTKETAAVLIERGYALDADTLGPDDFQVVSCRECGSVLGLASTHHPFSDICDECSRPADGGLELYVSFLQATVGVERDYSRVPEPDRGLQRIDDLWIVLRKIGSSAVLKDEFERIRQTYFICERTPDFRKKEETMRLLNELATFVDLHLRKALICEWKLADMGWKVATEGKAKGKLVYAHTEGNAPKQFLSEIIVEVFQLLEPEYRRERPNDKTKVPQALRERIRDRLAFRFDDDLVGAEKGGPIDRAIRNWMK